MCSLDTPDDILDERYEISRTEDGSEAEIQHDFMDYPATQKDARRMFHLNTAYPIFQAMRWAGKEGCKIIKIMVQVRSCCLLPAGLFPFSDHDIYSCEHA